MSSAFVEAFNSGAVAASATRTVTLTNGAAVGDTLVAAAGAGASATLNSVSDPSGNTWSIVAPNTASAHTEYMAYCHVTVAIAAAADVTFTWSAASVNGASVARFTGLEPVAPIGSIEDYAAPLPNPWQDSATGVGDTYRPILIGGQSTNQNVLPTAPVTGYTFATSDTGGRSNGIWYRTSEITTTGAVTASVDTTGWASGNGDLGLFLFEVTPTPVGGNGFPDMQVMIGVGQGYDTSPVTYTDLSPWVCLDEGIDHTYGRQDALSVIDPPTLAFTVDIATLADDTTLDISDFVNGTPIALQVRRKGDTGTYTRRFTGFIESTTLSYPQSIDVTRNLRVTCNGRMARVEKNKQLQSAIYEVASSHGEGLLYYYAMQYDGSDRSGYPHAKLSKLGTAPQVQFVKDDACLPYDVDDDGDLEGPLAGPKFNGQGPISALRFQNNSTAAFAGATLAATDWPQVAPKTYVMNINVQAYAVNVDHALGGIFLLSKNTGPSTSDADTFLSARINGGAGAFPGEDPTITFWYKTGASTLGTFTTGNLTSVRTNSDHAITLTMVWDYEAGTFKAYINEEQTATQNFTPFTPSVGPDRVYFGTDKNGNVFTTTGGSSVGCRADMYQCFAVADALNEDDHHFINVAAQGTDAFTPIEGGIDLAKAAVALARWQGYDGPVAYEPNTFPWVVGGAVGTSTLRKAETIVNSFNSANGWEVARNIVAPVGIMWEDYSGNLHLKSGADAQAEPIAIAIPDSQIEATAEPVRDSQFLANRAHIQYRDYQFYDAGSYSTQDLYRASATSRSQHGIYELDLTGSIMERTPADYAARIWVNNLKTEHWQLPTMEIRFQNFSYTDQLLLLGLNVLSRIQISPTPAGWPSDLGGELTVQGVDSHFEHEDFVMTLYVTTEFDWTAIGTPT